MTAHHGLQRQLGAYLDGELLPEEAAEVRRHLAECAACTAELHDLRTTRTLLRRLSPPPVPDDFVDDLRARLAAEATAGRRAWWGPVPRPAVLAAAVAVVLLVGLPLALGRLERLRAAEAGPDLFVRAYVPDAAADPLMDRAYLGLLVTDASLRLIGEDPREVGGRR